MHVNYLDTLDWGILITYFLILIGIGIWASLKRKKGTSLFLAERSLKWHHIGFSMWGTNVGPSMLIASASAGFTTGIVSGNYAWYAFVFICLLAFVFAPRYLGARITTLPEFMGRRFGQSTRNILAWYTIVTILISWLALTLFAGGILIRQVFDIPMWQSAIILLVISAFFTMAGGLKAVAYTNVFQMLLLIFVSATLTIAGLYKVGGVSALAGAVPADYWNLFRPNDDPAFPWLPIILGYPIMGVWFWCTDQSMVQPVLAAKNLKEGQMGANFTGWLKILDVPLYILPGIICLALYPGLKNPDEAYMTMVTNLFPVGMVGLVLAVLTAALISTVGSALNALSTVFTMDIYVKKFRQTFMPLHKQCLGVYQNKSICLSSGNQSRGCNSLSKGCRCRQYTIGKWHEGIDGIQLFIAFLSFECYANRFTMICIINYFIINFEGIQHVDNGILTPSRHCKIFIGKICTADNTRNVICGNTHRLFAVKFRIFERRNMFQMITNLI